MPDPPLTERLKFFFMSMGYTQNHIVVSEGKVVVTETNGLATIIPIEEHQLADRNSLVDLLITASTLRSESNRAYLAVPRLFVATYDAQPFQRQGVGLLVYDSRRIEEILEAKRIENVAQNSTPKPLPSNIEDELVRLRNAYSTLEESVRALRDELSSLRKNELVLKVEPPRPDNATVSALSGETSPSFFSGNPWLDVLSKRGKESYVA